MRSWDLYRIEHPSIYYIVYKGIESFIMYVLVLVLLRNLQELNTKTI